MAYPDITWDTGNMYGRTTDPSFTATTGGANGTDKLWLPIWSGEVIRAYDHYRVFEPMVESRSIASGRAMEFPITGTVAMKSAWGAGEELVGNIDDHVSKTIAITLDARPIASHFEIDNIDLMISQWEFRSELARQAGQTLANARDLQVGAYLVRAGVESQLADDPRLAGTGTSTKWRNTLAPSPFFNEGNKAGIQHLGLTTSTADERTTAALLLLECIEEFMVHLQEINAPTNGVYCAVTPRVFHDIRALGVARSSTDLTGGAGRPYFGGVAEAGGLGSGLTDGMMALSDSLEYMGCRIVKTNHLPNMDASKSGYNIGEARYNLNFSSAPHDNVDTTYGPVLDDAADGLDVRAIIWQSGSVASIQKTGLKVDTVDDVRRNTVFTVASIMAGTGVLKPECAAVVSGKTVADKTTARTLLGMSVYSGAGAEWTNTASGSGYYG